MIDEKKDDKHSESGNDTKPIVMRRFNYLAEAKSIAVRGIREHKTFPAHMKDEAVSIIQTHFEAMGKMIAAIELTYLRSQNGA